MGQGSGQFIPDGSGDRYTDADEDDSDDEGSDEHGKHNCAESKRRRIQAREAKRERDEWRQRAEAAEARLAESGQGATGPDPSEVILSLVEAGMSKDRIRAAMKLVDWSRVADVDDAIDDLREEHPFLFEAQSSPQQQQGLPPQGSKGNRDKNKGGAPSQTELLRKYPSLRRGF